MEKPKNLYVKPMDMNWGVRRGHAGGSGGAGWRGIKRRKNGTTVIA